VLRDRLDGQLLSPERKQGLIFGTSAVRPFKLTPTARRAVKGIGAENARRVKAAEDAGDAL
jgi:hypothetical protein